MSGTVAVAARERPILFTGAMVRAILAGTKTQTRRLVKSQPKHTGRGWDWNFGKAPHLASWPDAHEFAAELAGFCPYGVTGDRLWVRETWGYTRQCDDINGPGDVVAYRAGHPWLVHEGAGAARRLRKTDGGAIMQPNHWCDQPARWVPSIHMPRWASRLTLEVTDVRVQRLHEISESDAWAEGIERTGANAAEIARNAAGDRSVLVASILTDAHHNFASAVEAYAFLWDSINGDGSWEANPWVWAISFKRMTP